jgi:hypothetical protein
MSKLDILGSLKLDITSAKAQIEKLSRDIQVKLRLVDNRSNRGRGYEDKQRIQGQKRQSHYFSDFNNTGRKEKRNNNLKQQNLQQEHIHLSKQRRHLQEISRKQKEFANLENTYHKNKILYNKGFEAVSKQNPKLIEDISRTFTTMKASGISDKSDFTPLKKNLFEFQKQVQSSHKDRQIIDKNNNRLIQKVSSLSDKFEATTFNKITTTDDKILLRKLNIASKKNPNNLSPDMAKKYSNLYQTGQHRYRQFQAGPLRDLIGLGIALEMGGTAVRGVGTMIAQGADIQDRERSMRAAFGNENRPMVRFLQEFADLSASTPEIVFRGAIDLKNMGKLSNEQIKDYTKSFNTIAFGRGMSAIDTAGAQRQILQSFRTGNWYQQDINALAGRGFDLYKIMSEYSGKNISAPSELAQFDADEIILAFESFVDNNPRLKQAAEDYAKEIRGTNEIFIGALRKGGGEIGILTADTLKYSQILSGSANFIRRIGYTLEQGRIDIQDNQKTFESTMYKSLQGALSLGAGAVGLLGAQLSYGAYGKIRSFAGSYLGLAPKDISPKNFMTKSGLLMGTMLGFNALRPESDSLAGSVVSGGINTGLGVLGALQMSKNKTKIVKDRYGGQTLQEIKGLGKKGIYSIIGLSVAQGINEVIGTQLKEGGAAKKVSEVIGSAANAGLLTFMLSASVLSNPVSLSLAGLAAGGTMLYKTGLLGAAAKGTGKTFNNVANLFSIPEPIIAKQNMTPLPKDPRSFYAEQKLKSGNISTDEYMSYAKELSGAYSSPMSPEMDNKFNFDKKNGKLTDENLLKILENKVSVTINLENQTSIQIDPKGEISTKNNVVNVGGDNDTLVNISASSKEIWGNANIFQ